MLLLHVDVVQTVVADLNQDYCQGFLIMLFAMISPCNHFRLFLHDEVLYILQVAVAKTKSNQCQDPFS